jgi:cyclophilin family peptidyl-prolyl cis-trans isomerase
MMRRMMMGAAAALVVLAGASGAATQSASDWRTVAPENLWVIDTVHGRILVELAPEVAPQNVARIRTLTSQGFYDGLTFHRVIANFMAQGGDPLGTGAGGSDLPDVAGEFSFRRGRAQPFAPVTGTAGAGLFGIYGALPVQTQPDAQMMITADNRVDAVGQFCPGVVGMARSGSPDSANSQFFLMTGANARLNGGYTVMGRVISGMEAVRALKLGSDEDDGKVTNPDTITRARMASDMPEGERPSARVLSPRSARFAEIVAAAQASKGARLSICDIELPAEIS